MTEQQNKTGFKIDIGKSDWENIRIRQVECLN